MHCYTNDICLHALLWVVDLIFSFLLLFCIIYIVFNQLVLLKLHHTVFVYERSMCFMEKYHLKIAIVFNIIIIVIFVILIVIIVIIIFAIIAMHIGVDFCMV